MQFTPEQLESAAVYVEVYPMRDLGEDGGTLAVDGNEPDYWDVSLRPDDWDNNNNQPYAEFENLDEDQRDAKIAELEAQHPGIAICWVPV